MQSRLADYRGEEVRVTGERLNHLLEDHPEIKGREHWLSETLAAPETVVRSRKDPTATLYYRRYNAERIGEKYLASW